MKFNKEITKELEVDYLKLVEDANNIEQNQVGGTSIPNPWIFSKHICLY
ncbi:hypothetical protein [Streptococcus sobrinus]|nr:hypothetical protein [Streptococcus sobrinus]